MKTKVYLTLGLILMLNGTLTAQNSCSICIEALKQGTKDEFFKENKHTLDESVNTLYSYDYDFWEKYQSTASQSTSLSAAYAIFSASFGSTSTSSQRKEMFNKQKSTYQYSRSLAQNDYEKISQTLISKIPYSAFMDCVKSTCSNGIFVDYETTGDNILVTVRWVISQGSSNQQTSLKQIPTVANAIPIDYNFQKGVILKPFNSISGLYKRVDPKQDAIFSFDFENFPTNKIIVKRSQYQNTSLPVGTIVASTLDYATFCSLNEIPLNVPVSELIWVPADGRDVSASIYGKRQANVPDLRGTFLRGLNIFDPVNNRPFASPEQKDPENRSVNSLQLQSVQPHSHPISDPGHTHNWNSGNGWATKGGDRYARNDAGYDTPNATTSSATGITVNNNAGVETRPTNIAVYYYVKIN